jgi:GAF domain-containing protein/HAMP domain-containing protein
VNEKLNATPVKSMEDQRLERTAFLVSLIALGIVLIGTILIVALGEFRLLLLITAPLVTGCIVSARLARRGQNVAGSSILIGILALIAISIPFATAGQGVPIALGVLGIAGVITVASWPRRLTTRALAINLAIAGIIILIDLFGPAGRPQESISIVLWLFTFGILIVYMFFIAQEFHLLDIRTKIILGILVMGVISLGSLSYFAIDRTREITESVSQRLETSVSLLAEEQLVNVVFNESERVSQFFDDIAKEVARLAKHELALQDQKDVLSLGNYWDASSKLTLLDGGQYGNPSSDVSSVFVPMNTELNDEVFAELNTSAYLDFSVPQLLEDNPAVLAVYYISRDGVVRYYPNIELASILPPDFDATTRPYYELTSPLFNPQRLIRWTIPYVDAAGGGLVVTVASPVYDNNDFLGVLAADIQLSTITERISSIKIGSTGYAFMIDDAGRIISMPPAGYELHGMDPDEFSADEYFKQTVLGRGNADIRAIVSRMVAGGSGLNIVNVKGSDAYITYARVPANDYSIALVVPVSEMQTAIAIAREETQAQTQAATRTAAIILAALFLGAILFSLGLGQIIVNPVRRLTEVASRIAGGELTAQADSTTTDEIGILADSFNIMTSRLRETLDGLEQNVQERTAELVVANEKNENRAKQFESIAQVTRTIGSTQNLDSLLPQLTTVISREFGFYHVGVFLTDNGKEYAILSAANSEGGQVMLARGHRLKVGEVGMVGYVTGTGKARVALDTGKDAVFFNNPDLPETHSEIALPLRIGEDVIGALDVQSTQINAFSQEDVNILSILADQVSIAIQNARQFEETRKALSESDVLSRQFIQTGWQQFTKTKKLAGILHTGAKSSLLYTNNGKGREQTSSNTGQLRVKGRGAILSLPVKLRGEVIGSVDVRAPENRQWDQDEIDIVTAIIERAALAMENARLLAESQKLAAKERTIGDISAKISAKSDVNELLKTAVQELGRTLPGMDIAIQFKKEESE